LVNQINKSPDYKVILCCCGHEKYPPSIIVRNKRNRFKVFELFTKIELGYRKGKRYYKKDKEGYYFIPEIINNDRF